MSDKQKVIDETKQLVSSILTSEKYGLPLPKLERVFQEFVGYSIPYRKMGFNNGKDFFCEIPDAVTVSYDPNGQIHLDVVTTEKIARVRKLVERQKDPVRRPGVWRSNNSRQRGRGAQYGYNSNRRYPQPYRLNHMQQQNPPRYGQQQHYTQHEQSRYDRGRRTQSSTPREDDWSYPGVETTYQKSSDARRRINKTEELDWEDDSHNERASYHSYKKSSSHQYQRKHGHDSMEVLHTPSVPATFRGRILDLLISYPNGLLASNFETVYERRYNERLSVVKMGFATLMDMLQSLRDLIELERLPNGEMKIHQKKLRGISGRVQRKEFTELADLTEDIRKILQGCGSQGISCSRLPAEFKILTGTDLPVQKLGYQSVVKLVADMSDIAKVIRTSEHDWTAYDIEVGRQQEIETSYTTKLAKQSEAPITKGLEADARRIMREVKETDFVKFPELYYDLTGETLDVQKFGFSSLEMLALWLCQRKVVSMHNKLGKVYLRFINEDPSSSVATKGNDYHESARVPEDAVGAGVNFRPLLPEVVISNAWMEMYVCNVTNPSKLWLQLKGKQYTEALEDLMDKLEEYYQCPEGDSYKIPENMITEGQTCAAIFPEDNNWHRVVITRVQDESYVEGYFVDYGGSCSLHKKSLRLLKRSLMKLPAQAIRGRLANIKPHNKQWEFSASDRLLGLVSNTPLIGLVTHIDKDGTVSVCLCDTSGKDDVHINDILVEEGYAVFAPDDWKTEDAPGTPETNEESLSPVPEQHTAPAALEPDLRSAIELAEEECGEDEEIETVRYLKYVELTDEYHMHIVSKDGKPYVTGPELSHILFGKDILRSKLRTMRIQAVKLVVAQQDMPGLFEEFEELQLVGTKDKEYMTLYELESALKILEMIRHPSQELKEAVAKEIEMFDPDDPYWKGEDDDTTVSSASECQELSVEYLEKAVEMLRYRRHKILKAMVEPSNDEIAKIQTDELFDTERRIGDLLARIREKKERENKHATTESDLGDNNEFIDSTIEKMYAKDRQRLNMLKQPTTSDSPCKPVAAVVGTNISHQTSDQTSSVQATSDVSQVQNNLSDFISSLSLTGNAETKPDSNSLGNETLSSLQPRPPLESNAVPGIPQLTVNPVQLQHQQQMLQMQLLQMQQLMLQNMSAYGAPIGHGGMPNVNYSMGGVGSGVSTANIQGANDAKSSVDAALDMVTTALIVNPTLGRGSHSTDVRPPPGGFQKRD